ncbi:MAG TPA: hypothetical protein VMU71_11630 [Terracidiphilus sp.]|nr:hypothetical protein [Terracidiphilus sp.]
MYAVIRHYQFKPEDSAEIDRMIREEFLPLIRGSKGFVRYYWLDNGGGEGASFGLYEDRASAIGSIRLAADFARERMGKLVTVRPKVVEGPVAAHD